MMGMNSVQGRVARALRPTEDWALAKDHEHRTLLRRHCCRYLSERARQFFAILRKSEDAWIESLSVFYCRIACGWNLPLGETSTLTLSVHDVYNCNPDLRMTRACLGSPHMLLQHESLPGLGLSVSESRGRLPTHS